MKNVRLVLVGIAACSLLTGLLTASGIRKETRVPSCPAYKSPLGLAIDAKGQRAWVALHTADAVAEVDLDKGKVLREIAVGRGPNDLAIRNGKLFISCEDDDFVAVLDTVLGKIESRLSVGQAPQGVAIVPGDARVFVACRDDQSLCAVDPQTGKCAKRPLPGWPSRLALFNDPQEPSLLVLSSVPGKAFVSVIEPAGLKLKKAYELEGVTNARGLAGQMGPASSFFVAHQRPKTNVPTTQIAQGWVFTNVFTTFFPWRAYLAESQRSAGTLLDTAQHGQADPSDLIVTPDNRYVFVACAGSDTVLVMTKNQAVYATYGMGGEREDLSLSRKLIEARFATGANPRRLALSGDGRVLVAANYLGDSLTVIDVPGQKVVRTIALGGPTPDAARRGKILFHSNKLTHLGQFTCSSCHPNGQSDGLNWDLTRDGVGNFMNTRSLLGVKDTPGYGWYSSSPTLADRMTGTMRNLHHHEPTTAELAELEAYLKTLAPPRPLPGSSADQAAALRGKVLFEGKARCTACHAGASSQDGLTHNVGTRSPQDTSANFDTPSLRGVARTAPYLHDGRAATLQEVFTRHNREQRHGQAHQLTAEELADLVAYLRSL
jgi:DNA-binding beta-propeller fold protein YncE